jgi:hypothetical protein
MPRIPLPTVGRQVTQGPGSSAPTVTPFNDQSGRQVAQFGAAVQQAGQGLSEVGTHLQNQFDVAAAKEADNLAADVLRSGLGTYLQTQGKAATGDAYDQTFKGLRQKIDAIGKSLKSPNQVAMFRRSVDSRMQDALYKADEHKAKQVLVYAMAETETQANSALRDAVASYGTDESDVHLGTMNRAIDEIADMQGWGADSEQRKALHLKASTDFHSLVIDSLVTDGKLTQAAQHLEQNADEIDPARRAVIDKVVKKATVADKAQRLQRAFSAEGLSTIDSVRKINEMFDNKQLTVEEQDEAVRRVAYNAELQGSLQARASNELLENAKAQVLGGQELTPQQKEALRLARVLDDFNAWSGHGGQHKTSDAGLFTMQKLQEDPTGFGRYNSWDEVFKDLRGQLDDSRLDTVASMWRKWRGIDTSEDALKMDLDLQITRALKDMTLLPEVIAKDKFTPEQTAMVDRFTAAVIDDVNSHVTGRKAGAKDVYDAITRQKRNSLKIGDVPTPVSISPNDELQDGIWSTPFGDVAAEKITPAFRANAKASLLASGRREEDIYDIDIATEFARYATELNKQTQEVKAANLSTGESRLRAFYKGRINTILQQVAVDRQAWAEMELATEANVPAAYPGAMPTAESLHVGVRDYVIEAFGDEMAHFGLSVEQMRRILDKEGNYVPRKQMSTIDQRGPF